ncbi:flagellar motor switch protein FliM [bacterium]|nr:flagellar motor switch protein FliM [bacterium]
MAEVLSQDEINALLHNVSAEKPITEQEEPEKEAQYYLYDFKHPNRVSKDQLRNLRTIHEGFSRMLATYLTTLLRTIVDVQLLSIDQVTFLEFTMAMSNPGCIWVFDIEEYEGRGIVEVSPDLILLTIERLFGGEGKQTGEIRSLSVIEQNVASKIIRRILSIYDEAWEKAVALHTNMISFEMNPQFAQVAPASETAVVLFLEVNVRNTTFPLNICFPYFVLEPIIQKLTSDAWITHSSMIKSNTDIEKLNDTVENTDVIFRAELGTSIITMGELLDLEKGDIVILDRKVTEPIELIVGERARFRGEAGQREDKLIVRILEEIVTEEDLVSQDPRRWIISRGNKGS